TKTTPRRLANSASLHHHLNHPPSIRQQHERHEERAHHRCFVTAMKPADEPPRARIQRASDQEMRKWRRAAPPERAYIGKSRREQPVVDVRETHCQKSPEQQEGDPSRGESSNGQERMVPDLVDDLPNGGGHRR